MTDFTVTFPAGVPGDPPVKVMIHSPTKAPMTVAYRVLYGLEPIAHGVSADRDKAWRMAKDKIRQHAAKEGWTIRVPGGARAKGLTLAQTKELRLIVSEFVKAVPRAAEALCQLEDEFPSYTQHRIVKEYNRRINERLIESCTVQIVALDR